MPSGPAQFLLRQATESSPSRPPSAIRDAVYIVVAVHIVVGIYISVLPVRVLVDYRIAHPF